MSWTKEIKRARRQSGRARIASMRIRGKWWMFQAEPTSGHRRGNTKPREGPGRTRGG